MDDPLIGLTIYDTTKGHVDVASKNSIADGLVDSGSRTNFEDESGKMKLEANRASGSRLEHASEDCFPCLPSIPDDLGKERTKRSKGSESSQLANSDCVKVDTNGLNLNTEMDTDPESKSPTNYPVSQPRNFWLMRLFQSNLFDMSIAIGYLFNSKDHDVQSYLGSRLFVSVLM